MDSVLNAQASEQAKDIGMETVEEAADTNYTDAVIEVIRIICLQQHTLCSDDVAREMCLLEEKTGIGTHDRRVIGPLFKRAQKLGFCQPLICPHCKSVVTSKTAQIKSHRSPMQHWESLIYIPQESHGKEA
jgi:hypothetical protein